MGAQHYPNMSASAGIHPNVDPSPEETLTVEQLIKLADHDKVIAIGETGLDYFRSGRERSRRATSDQTFPECSGRSC
ncbi:MAG: TatD family hydrolase [Gammaproteobacteria bacterium]|nr:TatD family hydrolase [Gammaproteobacteria bacterium]